MPQPQARASLCYEAKAKRQKISIAYVSCRIAEVLAKCWRTNLNGLGSAFLGSTW